MLEGKRIALYGGTFDPVHLGHLEVARRVSELFEIEKVVFIPAQIAPHKIGRPVTEPIHRYAMLALATQDDPRLVISTFELDAPDRRYTVDTIAEFQRRLPERRSCSSSWAPTRGPRSATWRDWERLLKMTNHIVVTRPGYEVPPAPEGLQERIFFTDAVMKDISATNIRRLASAGALMN